MNLEILVDVYLLMSFLSRLQKRLEKFYAIPILGTIPSILNIPITIARWIRTKNSSLEGLNDSNYNYINPTVPTLESIREFECDQSRIGIINCIANTLTLSFLGTYVFFKDITNFKVIYA